MDDRRKCVFIRKLISVIGPKTEQAGKGMLQTLRHFREAETGDEALECRRVLWRSEEKFVENALKYLSCSLVLILSVQNV